MTSNIEGHHKIIDIYFVTSMLFSYNIVNFVHIFLHACTGQSACKNNFQNGDCPFWPEITWLLQWARCNGIRKLWIWRTGQKVEKRMKKKRRNTNKKKSHQKVWDAKKSFCLLFSSPSDWNEKFKQTQQGSDIMSHFFRHARQAPLILQFLGVSSIFLCIRMFFFR